MNLNYTLNTTSGSCLIIILIFFDYIHKSSTNRTQRKIFCSILVFFFCSAIFSALHSLVGGVSSHIASIAANAFNNAYFVFQIFTYYYIFIFADYTIFSDDKRIHKLTMIVRVILLLHILGFLVDFIVSIFLNANDAPIWQKSEFFIKTAVCYLPILFMLCDFFSSYKSDKKSHSQTILVFACITFVSLILDTIFGTAKLIWPCLTAALLYAYFIIIRTDIQIDTLTGIGNRYSFNEFIDKLSRLNTGESYAIVMIDMDHLKEINDTLGHQEGDNALKDTAAIIKKCIRSSDFAARYGGDEFVLATNAKFKIEKLMERIQQAIDAQNEKHIRPFKLQISYGYDVYTTSNNQTIEEFLAHIDNLMYKHKQMRRRTSDAIIRADI